MIYYEIKPYLKTTKECYAILFLYLVYIVRLLVNKHLLMESNLFYKYYTINQNLYSSIINNELYFSNPRHFNDPFDSFPRFKLTDDIEKLKTFFHYLKLKVEKFKSSIISNPQYKKKLKLSKNTLKFYNEAEIFNEKFYRYEIENLNDKIIELLTFYVENKSFDNLIKSNIIFLQEKMYYDYIFLTIDYFGYGISCGSQKSTCPLMWGHYANNHKGICIRYDLEENNISYNRDNTLEILNVKYSDEPINIFGYSSNELDNLKFEILTNKYSKWKYENEVRLINKGQGLLKINKKTINEIIFGCKSSHKDRYSLLKLFGSLGYNIEEIKIAKRLPDKYELSIQEMTINDITESGAYIEELNFNPRK